MDVYGCTIITGCGRHWCQYVRTCVCVCIRVYICACCSLYFSHFARMAEAQKMKVRVELMVVKGPCVYLVLVNMKYNLSPLSLSPSLSLCLWQ